MLEIVKREALETSDDARHQRSLGAVQSLVSSQHQFGVREKGRQRHSVQCGFIPWAGLRYAYRMLTKWF